MGNEAGLSRHRDLSNACGDVEGERRRIVGKPGRDTSKTAPMVHIAAIAVAVVLIIIVSLFIFRPGLKRRAERLLGMDLPPVAIYERKDFTKWSVYNDFYPDTIAQYVFKETDELTAFAANLTEDSEWRILLEDQLAFLPGIARLYAENCDYCRLIKLSAGKHILACYQIENKRQIIIEFSREEHDED